jgi:hypothetical protein
MFQSVNQILRSLGLAMLAPVAMLGMLSCSRGIECFSQKECEIGHYCLMQPGVLAQPGECVRDCDSNSDCPSDGTALTSGVCSNEGRCVIRPIPPRLRVLSPENDSLLPWRTRRVQLGGELESVAAKVTVTVTPMVRGSCESSPIRSIVVENPDPGRRSTFPFVFNDYELDPGVSVFTITAQMGNVRRSVQHILEVPCFDCATISIDHEATPRVGEGLQLARLKGVIAPAAIEAAIWRVRNDYGDVLDGPLELDNGIFDVPNIPLFPGQNRLQVVVPGQGENGDENRCSFNVTAGQAQEKGLRSVLTWDGKTSDLDIHLVGPGGRLFDPMTSIWSRNPEAHFEAMVEDDFDGLGPELASIGELGDGVYGVVVDPVFDGQDPGSNAFMRILIDGRPAMRRPAGPQYLSFNNYKLWIVGTVTSSQGVSSWNFIDERVEKSMPPTTPPSAWPTFY